MALRASGTPRPAQPVTPPLVHESTVNWVLFSPDGSRLATASSGGMVRSWDVATGRLAAAPGKHDRDVVHLAYSADGLLLASAGLDGTARVWDSATGSLRFPPLRHDTGVSCVAFHPGGRVLLTACSDGSFEECTAQQWEMATGRRIGPAMKHDDGVLWAAYSPDGSRVATASEDRTARIWNATTGEPATPPLKHRHQVVSLDFSPDGRRLATCALDGTARVWDASTGEPLSAPLPHQDDTKIESVKFRPDGAAILTSGQDGTARSWDLPTDDRPVEALILEAEARAGRRIDQTGGEVAFNDRQLAIAWAKMRRDWPSAKAAPESSASQIAWHRREARRLTANRRSAAAAWHLNRLAELNPADIKVAVELAAAYEAARDWTNVVRASSLAIAAGSKGPETLVERAWARLQLGLPAEAAADFRKALEREPGAAAFRLGLFLTAAELGDQTGATEQWRRVIDDHDEPRIDRWNAAVTHLSLLIERRPECWWLWRARGHLRMRMGHPDQSEADFDKAINVRPDDSWSWLGRGLARKSQNQTEPALTDLARSAALEPRVATGWGARGEILGAKGRWDEAAGDFARWSASGGDPVAIPWYFHALLRVYAKDHHGYRQACATMWERYSNTSDPFIAALLAHACSLGPDCGVALERVIALAEKAASAMPEDGWALFTLGAALRRAGRFEQAITKFDEATRTSPRGTYVPLIAAMQQLTNQSASAQPGPDPATRSAINKCPPHNVSSKSLASEIKKNNAAWQYQVEAILLGRDLDAAESSTNVQEKSAQHPDDG